MRAVAVLAGGAAAAHALTALAMPLLSRIYSPTDFGVLAVYTAIVTTIGVAAGLRFDVAVALPESADDGLALLCLSLLSASCVALVAAVIVGFGFERLSGWIDTPGIDQGKWLIPLGIFSAAAWSTFQNWQVRNGNFGLIAKSRLAQSGAAAASQISGGLFAVGPLGLMGGSFVGFLVSGIFLSRGAGPSVFGWVTQGKLGVLRRVAYEYRRFPAYSTWEALFNQAAIQLPIVVIAAATSASEAGSLMLALYVLQAPMALLGAAIGQAYLSRAPQALRDGSLANFTNEVLGKLVKVGAGPIVALGIVSPVIFPVVFGSAWDRAGWLVTWMTPWFVLQFIVSPVSMVLHVVGAQRMAMVLQLFSLVVRLGATWLAVRLAPMWVVEAYAVSGLLTYFVYFLVVKNCVGAVDRGGNACAINLVTGGRYVLPWAIGAFVILFLIRAITA